MIMKYSSELESRKKMKSTEAIIHEYILNYHKPLNVNQIKFNEEINIIKIPINISIKLNYQQNAWIILILHFTCPMNITL